MTHNFLDKHGVVIGELVEFISLFLLSSAFIALIFGHFNFTGVLLLQDTFQVVLLWLWFSVIKKRVGNS